MYVFLYIMFRGLSLVTCDEATAFQTRDKNILIKPELEQCKTGRPNGELHSLMDSRSILIDLSGEIMTQNPFLYS